MGLKKWVNRHIFRRVSASELFGNRPIAQTNIPFENLMDGVRINARSFNDPAFQSKQFRKKFDSANKYDLAEEYIYDECRSIISQIYNYPYNILPLMKKSHDLRASFLETAVILESFLNEEDREKEVKEWDCSSFEGYDKYLDYDFLDRTLDSLKSFNQGLLVEGENIRKALEMDDFAYEKIKQAVNRIYSLDQISEETVNERLIFHGYIREF